MDPALDLRSESAPSPQSEALATELGASLQEIARACELEVRISAAGNLLQLDFAAQENASAARIAQAWREELAALGIAAETRMRLPQSLDPATETRLRQGLAHVLRRIRTLLIEHNSYLCGGIDYPFADAPPGVAARGLAQYRYPARAEVDLHLGEDAVQIAFAPGPLGAITSSGFYLPSLFGGDFELSCTYRIERWRPCAEEAACFALFAQNEDSSRRYYAQRMSTGTQGHRLLASMADDLQGDREVAGDTGELRVVRRGAQLHCLHRSPGADWQQLGAAPAPGEGEMIVGAKIWSKQRCDGLCVTVSGLRIAGQLAARQVPALEPRPDPRSDPAPGP